MSDNISPDSKSRAGSDQGSLAKCGARLQACRAAAGYSLEQVALLTRISLNFIEALEAGREKELPAPVFVRGFIRNLCKAYGVDSKDYVAEYEAAMLPAPIAQPQEKSVNERPAPVREDLGVAGERPRASKMPWVAVAMGVLIVGVWFWARQQDPRLNVPEVVADLPVVESAEPPTMADSVPLPDVAESESPVLPVAQEAAAPAPEAVAELTPAPTKVELRAEEPAAPAGASGAEQVVEVVVSAPVRLRVQLDSKAATILDLQPQTYAYKFTDHAELLVFNAAAVSISFNGRSLGSIGGEGRRRRLSFAATPEAADKNL